MIEVKDLIVRENKYYEGYVGGKKISFLYDGMKVRDLWLNNKMMSSLDKIKGEMKAHNIAAEILGLGPVFQVEELSDD